VNACNNNTITDSMRDQIEKSQSRGTGVEANCCGCSLSGIWVYVQSNYSKLALTIEAVKTYF